MKRYVHISVSGVEPHIRATEMEEACEVGKNCSEEDDPAALSNGKKNLVYCNNVIMKRKVNNHYILPVLTWFRNLAFLKGFREKTRRHTN